MSDASGVPLLITPRNIRQFNVAQGNCTGHVDVALLAAWHGHMPGSRLPLRARQCLILTGSKALFAQSGQLWLHNLYLATVMPPREGSRQSLLLSTGYVGAFEWPKPIQVAAAADAAAAAVPGWEGCSGPTDLRLYLTDVFVHSPPHGGSRSIALMPLTTEASVSLLAKGAALTLPAFRYLFKLSQHPISLRVRREARSPFHCLVFRQVYGSLTYGFC